MPELLSKVKKFIIVPELERIILNYGDPVPELMDQRFKLIDSIYRSPFKMRFKRVISH